MPNTYNLIISCPDSTGLVAAVSGFIAAHDGMIIEADHHTDLQMGWFFMRYEIDADTLRLSIPEFQRAFQPLVTQFSMDYQIRNTALQQNILILASLEPHCVEDLLYRWHTNELNANIVGVVANHEVLRKRTEWYGIPFFYLPINKTDKAAHFNELDALIQTHKVETIVLARYMQILPNEFCEHYAGRIINIHHSFLPSFIGAKPYHQAYDRGVKLIGATSHYVTPLLDEGPIIEQEVVRITHRQTLNQYVQLGKDIERLVLARALKAHLEDRVIIHGNKTIVFT